MRPWFKCHDSLGSWYNFSYRQSSILTKIVPFSSGCVQQWRRLWLPDLIASIPITTLATKEREQEEEEEQESKKRRRSRNHDWVPEAEQGVSAGKSMSRTWLWWEIVHIINFLKIVPQVALPVSKSVFLALASTNPHLLQHQQPPRVPSPEVNLIYKNFCITAKHYGYLHIAYKAPKLRRAACQNSLFLQKKFTYVDIMWMWRPKMID